MCVVCRGWNSKCGSDKPLPQSSAAHLNPAARFARQLHSRATSSQPTTQLLKLPHPPLHPRKLMSVHHSNMAALAKAGYLAGVRPCVGAGASAPAKICKPGHSVQHWQFTGKLVTHPPPHRLPMTTVFIALGLPRISIGQRLQAAAPRAPPALELDLRKMSNRAPTLASSCATRIASA